MSDRLSALRIMPIACNTMNATYVGLTALVLHRECIQYDVSNMKQNSNNNISSKRTLEKCEKRERRVLAF